RQATWSSASWRSSRSTTAFRDIWTTYALPTRQATANHSSPTMPAFCGSTDSLSCSWCSRDIIAVRLLRYTTASLVLPPTSYVTTVGMFHRTSTQLQRTRCKLAQFKTGLTVLLTRILFPIEEYS